MCLAIPGQIVELCDDKNQLAIVDISGVRRKINVQLFEENPLGVGDWVLIHVGFAMSKISEEQAHEQLRLLAMLGESEEAMRELESSQLFSRGPARGIASGRRRAERDTN
jgi:hydrogenase expression/formation protein HypC